MKRDKLYIALIRSFLLLVLLAGLASCSSENESFENNQEVDNDPIVVYLVDTDFRLSKIYAQHLTQVFDYTKIPFTTIELSQFNNDPYLDYGVRVLYINNTEKLNEGARATILEFVTLGGTLIFPSLNEDQKGGFLSGIKPGANYDYELESYGVRFVKNLLPGMEGKVIYPMKANTGLVKDAFIDSIKIWATSSSDHKQPLIFEHPIGNGKVIHFNTSMELEKQDRGLLFAPALRGLQGVPYPIANVSAIFIDDFPNPLYDIDSEPIKSELKVNQADFVLDYWWPDMLDLANRFGIVYSAYPCFNYDRIKEPPFIFKEWDLNRTNKNGRELISTNWMVSQVRENNFELAFHGYNHESLNRATWENPENIESALIAARKKWKVNNFGSFPTSYVPPSNEIDSIGLVHLANAMPEIEFMSSLYNGDLHEGGGREFDIDPIEPRFFDFPRITSGYTFDNFKIYNQESLYLFTGIWTHFIHPDDVFQLPDSTNTSAGDYNFRNANRLGWYKSSKNRKGMLEEWTDYLSHVVQVHPSTRFLDVSSGARITRDWRESSFQYTPSGDAFNVEKVSTKAAADTSFFWNIFTEESSESLLQNELQRIEVSYTKTPFFGGFLYTIKTSEPQLIFGNEVSLIGESQFSMTDLFSQVKESYNAYIKQRDEPVFLEESDFSLAEQELIIEDSVEWFVANENLSAATDMLRLRLEGQYEKDTTNFDQYALYLAYQDKPNEVWDFFEYAYWEISEELGLDYVNHYLKKEAYPTEQLNELWLRRQIEADPGNIDLIKEYIKYFYSQEYQENVELFLMNLMSESDAAESYALYIKYLIDFNPEYLVEELEDKDPAQYPELHPLATTITYAFSDSGMIQQALSWSEFSDEIPIKTVLQWWIDLEAYNKMETVYLDYIKEHDLDYEVMDFVSNVWYDIGEYERGALIANKLPEVDKREKFGQRINPDVRYFEPDVQKFLIVKTPSVIDQDTLQAIKDLLRFNENSSIEYHTNYVVDNFNQSVWNNSVTYNMKTEKLNHHSLSVTYSDVSDLNLNSIDVNNVPHTLYGLKYRYQTRENSTKPIFYALGGIEQDDVSNTFLTIGAGISKSDEKGFKSVGYTFSPVKTGPAISREIYWGQLIGYYETGYAKTFQASFSPVLSHYTTGAVEGSLTGRFFYNTKKGTGSRFSPFAEAFVSGANESQENGNPYWIIDSRFYGGGGLAWTYGRDQSRKFYARVEGGAFYDSYTESFLRLTGNFSFPVKKYTYITGQFEFFNQALYYSNGFQFGIKHFFQRKKPYVYQRREYEEWYD